MLFIRLSVWPVSLFVDSALSFVASTALRGSYHTFNYDFFVGAPVRKPDHFKVPPYVAGFSVSMSF